MADISKYANGQFCWVDLMSKEMSAAQEFYTGLFGWSVEDQDTQGGPPYANFMLEGKLLSGLGQMSDEMQATGMPPVWSSYINVDDLDGTLAKAGELGANVAMPPMDVVDAGRMSIIQDPTGAFVCLWEPKRHSGAQLVNVPNTWVWNEIMTYDPQAASTFFSELLGWTFEKEQGSPGDYWMIDNNGRKNGGMLGMTKEEFGEMPPCWVVYFNITDMAASLDQLKALGGKVYREPFDSSVGSIAVVADSQGAAFNLIQMSVPPDE